MPLEIPRRQLITGLISLIAAPAIVRVTSIMPVRSMILDDDEDSAFDPEWAASWRCPYCGGMRGGMCPGCWRNAIMDIASSINFTEVIDEMMKL